jgi:hypothetical protein
MTLSDIPLTPYIENALEWWFKHEEWPPQASQLRERAEIQMRRERDEHKSAELLARYDRPREEPPLLPIEERRRILAALREKRLAEEVGTVS